MDLVIAPRARNDIATILVWTEENFGPRALQRYARLMQAAIADVAADPRLAGSVQRPEIGRHCRTYHLSCSRKKAGRAGDRVRDPRHFLLYRVTESNTVEIGRVLHDSMDLAPQVPPEYRQPRD